MKCSKKGVLEAEGEGCTALGGREMAEAAARIRAARTARARNKPDMRSVWYNSSPASGPTTIAILVVTEKYPMPSPRRDGGMTNTAIEAAVVVAKAKTMPWTRRRPYSASTQLAALKAAMTRKNKTKEPKRRRRLCFSSTKYPATGRKTLVPI